MRYVCLAHAAAMLLAMDIGNTNVKIGVFDGDNIVASWRMSTKAKRTADDSNIVNLHNWSLGSFSGTSWENVGLMALVVGAGLALSFLLSKPIGAYQMGEVYAQNMGVNIRRFRVELILLSSVLSACVTAFAGPISFVGIAVPHLVKGLFRTARPVLIIPACFLGGAAFCLGCDLIARTAFAPRDMSISSVTAVFGAPVVLCLMASRRGGRGGNP